MLLSISQGCLAGWKWEDGEGDLVDSDPIVRPDASDYTSGGGRLETHIEHAESDTEAIGDEEEEEEEEELEFQPRRKLWMRTDTSTSVAFESQGSTRKVSALILMMRGLQVSRDCNPWPC